MLATGIDLQIYQYRFRNGGRLILFKHILFSSIVVNNRVTVIENKQKIFQLQLQLSTFENFELQLQQIQKLHSRLES